jgi:hypothetical protein
MREPDRGPISEDDVAHVLANPVVSYVGKDQKKNVLGEAGGKRLRICYVEDETAITVVTVINRSAE